MKKNSTINRSIIADEPIVELILSNKFAKHGIEFKKNINKNNYLDHAIQYRVNGFIKDLVVKRNSSKYFKSSNFLFTIDKNKLNIFNNASFVFIDEVQNSLYIVDGIELLKYIISHKDKIMVEDDSTVGFILIPKKDIISIVSCEDNIINYGKQFAGLFEISRNEQKFSNLI